MRKLWQTLRVSQENKAETNTVISSTVVDFFKV